MSRSGPKWGTPMADDGAARAIEQLGVRYAAAIDARDFAGLAACFVADGVWAGPSGERCGRAEIARFAASAVEHLDCTQHLATNFLVTIEADRARMQSQFVATHRRDGVLFTIGGRYEDAILRVDGQWLFQRRDILPLWSSGDEGVMTG